MAEEKMEISPKVIRYLAESLELYLVLISIISSLVYS